MIKVIDPVDRGRMDEVTAGLPTKSAKIRALSAAGYERADIARYLGIRYQHVRNVLVRSAPSAASTPSTRRVRSHEPSESDQRDQPIPKRVRVRIGPGGRIVIPAPYREVMQVQDGDTVTLQLDGDEVRIVSAAAGIRRAQEIVRRYVPEGVSLVDELIADRRAEAIREASGD